MSDEPEDPVMNTAIGIIWCCGISTVVILAVIAWAFFF